VKTRRTKKKSEGANEQKTEVHKKTRQRKNE
jgi:hypothetical protein